jgi:hypothetical protein
MQSFTVVCASHLEREDWLELVVDRESIEILYEKADDLIFSIVPSDRIFSKNDRGQREDYIEAIYLSGSKTREKLPRVFSSFVREMEVVGHAAVKWLARHREAC